MQKLAGAFNFSVH